LERRTVVLSRVLLLVLAAASFVGCARFEPVTAAQLDRGYILLLPGVANKPSSMAGIAGGLEDAGIDHAIERDLWGSRPFGELKNVQSLDRNRRWAAQRAARLAEYRRSHPEQPITLVGYSGGGAIALFICESLPKDVKVDRAILLAAAVSPDYDLVPALQHCRRGIVNVYSREDWFDAGFLTKTFGTMDRKKTSAAGRRGFLDTDGRLVTRDDLTQIAWTPEWRKLGHWGGHVGYESRPWAREVLGPLVAEASVVDRR
jgi:pimeloyl-ACP methyl ester carboxylesterase